MNSDEPLSPLGSEIAAGLSELCKALESGARVEDHFPVRRVRLKLEPRPYGPDDVKDVRARFHASQETMAEFLGVRVKTIRAWESGENPVPRIACRYMDDLMAHPNLFTDRISHS